MSIYITTQDTHACMYWPLCWGQELNNCIDKEPSLLARVAGGTLIICMGLAMVVGLMCF